MTNTVSLSDASDTTPSDFASGLLQSVQESAAASVSAGSEVTTSVEVSETQQLQLGVEAGAASVETTSKRRELLSSIEQAACSGISGTCTASLISWRRARRLQSTTTATLVVLSRVYEYIANSSATVSVGSLIGDALATSGVSVTSSNVVSLSARSTVVVTGDGITPVEGIAEALSSEALKSTLANKLPEVAGALVVAEPTHVTPPLPPPLPSFPPLPSSPQRPPPPAVTPSLNPIEQVLVVVLALAGVLGLALCSYCAYVYTHVYLPKQMDSMMSIAPEPPARVLPNPPLALEMTVGSTYVDAHGGGQEVADDGLDTMRTLVRTLEQGEVGSEPTVRGAMLEI